jgi:hypothetical protein
MAGSYEHTIDSDTGNYRGVDLLENMGDMHEAVEQMFFMIGHLADWDRDRIKKASKAYYRCLRKERRWPVQMREALDRAQR